MQARAIIVISSHVVRGSVGNRAAVQALETLGFPVWALPTITLPWHPGHGKSVPLIASNDAFAGLLNALLEGPFVGEPIAIMSGYLANAGQAAAIAGFVRSMKRLKPDLVYLCDPVIGDVGGLYVGEDTAHAIADQLVPLADIVTPNRFELGWMTRLAVDEQLHAIEAAHALGAPTVLVTSAPPMMRGTMANLLVEGQKVHCVEHRALAHVPNGTGDLTAALFLGRIMAGQSKTEALSLASASVYELLMRTQRRGADELTLSQDGSVLVKPQTPLQPRVIGIVRHAKRRDAKS